MFWRPSLLVAEEPRRSPTRPFAMASGGIVASVTAEADPHPADVRSITHDQRPHGLDADVGGDDEEARRSGRGARRRRTRPGRQQSAIGARLRRCSQPGCPRRSRSALSSPRPRRHRLRWPPRSRASRARPLPAAARDARAWPVPRGPREPSTAAASSPEARACSGRHPLGDHGGDQARRGQAALREPEGARGRPRGPRARRHRRKG
jgi:hypothetical protein